MEYFLCDFVQYIRNSICSFWYLWERAMDWLIAEFVKDSGGVLQEPDDMSFCQGSNMSMLDVMAIDLKLLAFWFR